MEKFELPDNVIFKIKEDAKGRVWFFSHTGKLAYFKNEKVYPYEYNDSIQKNIKNLLITNAYITKEDEILLNSTTESNYKILKNGTIIYTNESPKNTELINITKQRGGDLFTQKISFLNYLFVKSLIISRKGDGELRYKIPLKLIRGYSHCGSVYGSHGSIYTFFGDQLFKLNIDGSYTHKKLPSTILSIYRDSSSGRLLLGLLKSGIYVYDSSLNKINNPILSGRTVTSISSDFEGNLWFSTLESGVYCTNANNTIKKHFSKLTDTETQRLYNYKDTILLLGNTKELKLNEGNKTLTLFRYTDTELGDIFISQSGTVIVVGHFNFKNNFKKTKSLHPIFKRIFTIAAGHETLELDNNIRLINISRGVIYADLTKLLQKKDNIQNPTSSFLTKNFAIQCMLKKDADNIFLGSINNLYLLTISKKKIRPFIQMPSVFNNGVTCISQIQNRFYAVGIRFGGIALTRDSDVVSRITETEGLLSNSIKYMLPIGNRLWIATPKGISTITFSSYNPIKYSIKNFAENAGMYNQIIYQLITFKGNILAATSNGVYEISNIEKLLNEKPLPIPLYITSVKYFKGDTSAISFISVPYNKSRVTINFNAICFNSPKEIQYFYRIANKDTTWYSTDNSQIILQNLSPGRYALEIKAIALKQNRVSDIKKLIINITKPWWQRFSILAAGLLLFFAGVYVFYKWRITNIRKLEAEKTQIKMQIADLEQTALRSQMNPHFIFNCLTSIQQLVVTGNKNDANEYLVRFARLIRKTLDQSTKPYILLFDEIEYLKEYLVLEQLRIPGKFEFNFEIDDSVDMHKTEIPNMMIQPLVENAIRHGIKHLENKKGKINIEIRATEEQINCTITDNGVGRKEALQNNSMVYHDHKSYGIDIVKQRLAVLTKNKKANYSLDISDLHSHEEKLAGTKVVLQLPFKIISL